MDELYPLFVIDKTLINTILPFDCDKEWYFVKWHKVFQNLIGNTKS